MCRVESFGFKIPEQQAQTRDSRDLRPKAIERWLADMPRANLGLMAKQVYALLTESNLLKLSPTEREQLLQQLYDPIDYILEAMEKHYIGLSLPFPAKNRKIARLAQSVLHEVVIAHKSIILDSINESRSNKSRLRLATMMQNHLAFNNRLLLCLHLTYSAIPKSFWREQCLIMQYAEQLSLADIAVFGSRSPWSVINRFKQALLLTASTPACLEQREIIQLNHLLETWVSSCRLLSMKKYTPKLHSLFVNLNSDDGPLYLEKPTQQSDGWRIIDTSSLHYALEDEITKARSNPHLAPLHKETLQRLQKQLGGEQKRVFSRSEKSDMFTLAIGISAIHWMLSHHIGHGNHDVARPACYMNSFVTSVGRDDAPDVWNVYREATTTTVFGEDRANNPVEYKTYDFNVVDESANGYKLKFKQNTTADGLKVGELVSLHKGFNGSGKQFGLALIRWVHQTASNELVIGIELIAPSATPVEIGLYAEEVYSEAQHKMRALLLPELRAIKQPATLVTPNTFKEGQRITLHHRDEDTLVLLKQQTKRGGGHALYQYENIEKVTKLSSKHAVDTRGTDDDLDSAWELL